MQVVEYTPGIYQYIPFLYVIWSDDLLSPSEVSVVKRVIQEDKTLSAKEKGVLNGWLNRDQPPKNRTIKLWHHWITHANIVYEADANYPLTAYTRDLVQSYFPIQELNPDLREIEINLGIQPNHYQHLFEGGIQTDSVKSIYSSENLARLHWGNHYEAVSEFQKFLGKPEFDWRIERNKESYRHAILEQLQLLAHSGYGALAYPDAYGGKNDMPLYAAIFENLIYVDASLCVKFGVQFGLFGGSIQKLGTKEHHDKYLTEAGNANLLGCFAMTETRHGSNVRGIRTTATYVNETDEIVIHTPGPDDNKEYIGNALHSTLASVFAQLIVNGKNEGVHAILIPLRDEKHNLLPGIHIEDNGYKLGLNGVDNGKIWFKNVRVPRKNLLNKYGNIEKNGRYTSPISDSNKRFFTMLGTLVGGRICVAKGALAGAKMGLAIAVKYALQRRQFNDNKKIQEDLIMDYPTHQLRLTPAIASCYVYHSALDRLIGQYSQLQTSDTRRLEAQVAGVKAMITWFANDTLQECREACGGKGYLLENRIPDLRTDIDIFSTFEGDNTVLMQLAAKGVLTDFKTEFNAGNFFGVLRLLSTQFGNRLSAINPLYTQKTDHEHLYNPAFHAHAFKYRTDRLTYTLAMRIRDYIKKGIPSYQAFLKVQTHLVTLGKAYSDQLCYELYTEYCESIEDKTYRQLFEQLGSLHALSRIRTNASWYLEQGYIGKTKSKAIRQRVERLSSELRPHIEELVEGFGIPKDRINNIPISS